MAAENGSEQAIERIWDWAVEVTYSLLSQDNEDTTAEGGHIKVVEKMWNWANEAQIYLGELQKKLLLVQDSERRTVWHTATQGGSAEILDKLWVWAEDLQLTKSTQKIKACTLH